MTLHTCAAVHGWLFENTLNCLLSLLVLMPSHVPPQNTIRYSSVIAKRRLFTLATHVNEIRHTQRLHSSPFSFFEVL